MSFKQGTLCSLLISEHFGEAARKLHDELQWGPRTLKLIISNTGLPIAVIKKCLCTFIHYGFVLFEANKTGMAEYSLQSERILLLLRYPKYLTLINNKYGEISKIIVEEVLKSGRITATNIILQVWNKIKAGSDDVGFMKRAGSLRDSLNQLITKEYLMRCPCPEESCSQLGGDSQTADLLRTPQLTVSDHLLHLPVQLDLQSLQAAALQQTADRRTDDRVYWRCNFDRFHQDMRDELLVGGVRQRFDRHAARLMEILLRQVYLRTEAWSSESNPVPLLEIRTLLDKDKSDPYLVQFLEQYVKIMAEDSCGFIKRTSESLSSSVYVTFLPALRSLAYSTIDSIVEHKFGAKAARIFRLVRSKIYIDQEQLQKLAMIPDKEAKQITYKLLQESFLYLHELKRPLSAGPVKNFYLFHVNFSQVVQVVLDICYKTVCNTLSRAAHDKTENSRLIEKVEKLTLLAGSLKEQGQDEEYIKQVMDELVSPPERSLLESVESMIRKLRQVELNIDETIFVLQLYSYYQSTQLLEKRTTQRKSGALPTSH